MIPRHTAAADADGAEDQASPTKAFHSKGSATAPSGTALISFTQPGIL